MTLPTGSFIRENATQRQQSAMLYNLLGRLEFLCFDAPGGKVNVSRIRREIYRAAATAGIRP